MGITKDMKVRFRTDEMGVFLEVLNWSEVRDYIQKAIAAVRKDLKAVPEMEKALKQIETTYSTKEAIEATSIKDVQQFHSFHGAKYKLGELLEGQLKAPNIYGKEPFDCDFSVYLDEINTDENNYVLRSAQVVNQAQLTNATYDYLTQLAKSMKTAGPKKEDIGDLKNETTTASRIHGTGWVIYSIQTTTVMLDNVTNIEERIIEIK